MVVFRALFWGLVLGCLAVALWGCAAEGVSKTEASQATGLAAFLTWLTAPITGGWSILVGFAAGLVRLFFASSTTTAAPGATERPPAMGVPLWLIFLAVLVFVKRNRVWALLTGGTHGRFDAFLRLIGFRTKPPPLPKVLQQGVS